MIGMDSWAWAVVGAAAFIREVAPDAGGGAAVAAASTTCARRRSARDDTNRGGIVLRIEMIGSQRVRSDERRRPILSFLA